MSTARKFEDKDARRERVPLLVGLMGPSGGGKTYSALRLASGIAKVDGRPIFVIDTEARRALHYADRFKFKHVVFGAPFSPLDYLAAIDHCVQKGAGTIVIDSMSHEHEGPGGLLEMHDQETKRLSAGDERKAERVKMLAWNRPKQERRRLINTMLQYTCNFVLCFRAKEKLKIEKGKEPTPMGFMAIAGEEFVFEMTVRALLMPGANGIPTWQTEEVGERVMVKLPEQFKRLMLTHKGPLDESVGEAMARWAAGENADPGSAILDAIQMAETPESLEVVSGNLEQMRQSKTISPQAYKDAKSAMAYRRNELQHASQSYHRDEMEPQEGTSDRELPHDPQTGEVIDN